MIFFVSQYKLKGQIKAYEKNRSRLFLDCNYENYSYDGTSIKTRIETQTADKYQSTHVRYDGTSMDLGDSA